MAIFIDITGKRFGKLVVLRMVGKRGNARYSEFIWECQCDCGNIVIRRGQNIKSGTTKSCGCLNGQAARERLTTHGESQNTKEYRSWTNIKSRCNNINNPGYYNYGGRGIKICSRWNDSFSDFLMDVGRAPSNRHSLDRINVNAGYEPGNVKWATTVEQSNNRTTNVFLEYMGEKLTIGQWATRLKVRRTSIDYQLRKGRDIAYMVNYYGSKKIYGNRPCFPCENIHFYTMISKNVLTH